MGTECEITTSNTFRRCPYPFPFHALTLIMNMESQYLTSESQESTVSWAPDIQSLILRLIRPKCAGPSYNEPTDPGFNYTIPSGNPNVGTYDCDSQDLDDTRCSATLPPALPPWAPRQVSE
jgi:hypothetical protein